MPLVLMRTAEHAGSGNDHEFLVLVQEELATAATAAANYAELARSRSRGKADADVEAYLDDVSASVARMAALARMVRARCRGQQAHAELAAEAAP